MHLSIILPVGVFIDVTGVAAIVAETREGAYGLLPRCRGCVAALGPGILTYRTDSGAEAFVAVGEGMLTKTGAEVCVCVRRATGGTDLAALRATVAREFLSRGSAEQRLGEAMARVESAFLRRFMDMRHG